jgi:hypothetical protein
VKNAALVGLATLSVLSACSPVSQRARLGAVSVPVEVTSVPLDLHDPSVRSIGAFVYSGGIAIRGADSGVHELSDLRIVSGDRLVAVSDRGSFFEARLLFDEAGRLSQLADARVIPLVDEQGRVLRAAEADAEGLDVLPDDDRLVSFEGDDRIWLYPADGSAPRPMARPDATFPSNEGMEAISQYPAAGPTEYLVGSERGTIWICRLSSKCSETPFGLLVPSGFRLTALSAYGKEGAFAMLGRSYDPLHGLRIVVRLISTMGAPGGRVLDEMAMAAPLTVDNFEGLAVVPQPAGGIRLYLLSDDNGSAVQHTYLFAFDWQPH